MENLNAKSFCKFKSVFTNKTLAIGLAALLPFSVVAQDDDPIFLTDLTETSFFDYIEPGVFMVQPGEGGPPGVGVIFGERIIFACGTSDDAIFTNSTDRLGFRSSGGPVILDGCSLDPMDIINNDHQFTGKVLGSEVLYDIDFKSWRFGSVSFPVRCWDNDGGDSCDLADDYTSYTRTLAGGEEEENLIACDGFFAPMDEPFVKAKKNRVFPLKMELFDADGYEVMGGDIAAPPMVLVMFEPSAGGDPVDVTADVLFSGKGSDGDQFVYTDDEIWQFNLKSKNYSGKGVYLVAAMSGDESEYVLDPACVTSFDTR